MEDLNLVEASELFTPRKIQSSFIIHDDNENESDDGLTKIPHGLTAKKERRKSFNPSQFTTGFQISPKRIPLTAPRPNVLNSFPINVDGPKRQLLKEFVKAQDFDENVQEFKISSPIVPSKRRSSIYEDVNSSKLQKIEDEIDEDDFILISNVSEKEDNEEGLSRIELDNDLSSKIDEVIEIPIDEEISNSTINISIQTPSRLTEPIALSPKTEQNSRVADESNLLLDTTKSPNFDDSFVTESPLFHNISNVSKNLDLLNDLESVNEESSPEKLLTTPKERPFFTINQVHNIQNEFQKKAEDFENSLREKSTKIIELNNDINIFKNDIFKLNDEISILEINKSNLIKEKDLMAKENNLLNDDIKELNSNLKLNKEKILRSTHLINKFKDKVNNLNNQILSKDSTILELNEDILSKSRAIEILTLRVKDFEDQASRLNVTLNEKINEIEQITKEKFEIESNLLKFENDLNLKNNEFENNKNLISNLTNEKSSLIDEISELNAKINLIESNQSKELFSLKNELSLKSKDLSLKDIIIGSLTNGSSTLRNSNEILRNEIIELKNSLNEIGIKFNDTSELLLIRKAEVDELNIEINSIKDEYLNLKRLDEHKGHELNELKQTLETRDTELKLQNEKLQELDLLLQKQDTDHLTELESLHSEMSNVQTLFSNKSNELNSIKEQKEALEKENDLFKYELESIKDEAISFNEKFLNLKSKLNESKIHNDTLEAQISQLSKEKKALETETDNRLQQLAEDLYIQYSKKHEQKVQVLKKGYETKWASKIAKFENENTKLQREIESLKTQLEQEKVEKTEIIKLWENLKKD